MHVTELLESFCLLGQTSWGFLWRLLQTLFHSHNLIFSPDWPSWHCTL